LLITFIELIKNQRYKFWDHKFTRCAPEIEKVFDSVARSCMGSAHPGASGGEVTNTGGPGPAPGPVPGPGSVPGPASVPGPGSAGLPDTAASSGNVGN
jgi:hypothetical protein